MKLTTYLILLIITSSCSLDQRLCRKYINSPAKASVLVLNASQLIKSNNAVAVSADDKLEQYAKDSILLAESIFLKHINDSAFLNLYQNNLLYWLENFGLQVFTDSNAMHFFNYDSTGYIFNNAQAELEEYLIPVEDYNYADTSLIIDTVVLKAVAFNCWFETSKLNNSDEPFRVLFSQFSFNDQVTKKYRYNYNSDITYYYYHREDLTTEQVYQLADYAARKNAEYIFDLTMNKYAEDILKTKKKPKKDYFHYYRKHNIIIPAANERFNELKN